MLSNSGHLALVLAAGLAVLLVLGYFHFDGEIVAVDGRLQAIERFLDIPAVE